MQKTLAALIAHRLSRREFLGNSLAAGAALYLSSAPLPLRAATASAHSFTSLPLHTVEDVELPKNYCYQLLAAWGDAVMKNAPDFSPGWLSADDQELMFGYNSDFIAYLPFRRGSADSNHGFLCVNHENTDAKRMFPPPPGAEALPKTRAQAAVELAAHGHSVLEIKKTPQRQWQVVEGSRFNRRLSARSTYFTLSGPAAGSARLQTPEDPTGTCVLGTLGNCAGGKTPWGTVLIAEENFNLYFSGSAERTAEERNYKRYGIGPKDQFHWARFYPRFDINKQLNEANRFGWVVEYDPYSPAMTPVKRTALGRFKHESATVTLAPDGRVVVYSGDDEENEYLYRFISKRPYNPKHRESNRNLLDEGTLSVAVFDAEGLLWKPLIYGESGLDATNGFRSQADVLIEARIAAEVLGATPMDRPEDIEIMNSGAVCVSLTNNRTRKKINPVNPRKQNLHGHIIVLRPPLQHGKPDHAASHFIWDMVLKGGNPNKPEDHAFYPGGNGCWLSCPDNLASDAKGNLWIATDGQPKTLNASDSLYCFTPEGELKRFLNAPVGAEVTGPEFTPDGTTLFLSIQHPKQWPTSIPRPAIIAVTHKNGEIL